MPLLPRCATASTDVGPEVQRALEDARTGAEAATVVPGLLGGDGPRRYLVLFTSPAEARGRFGFAPPMAWCAPTNGHLELEVAESIGELQSGDSADQSSMPLEDPAVSPFTQFGVTPTGAASPCSPTSRRSPTSAASCGG